MVLAPGNDSGNGGWSAYGFEVDPAQLFVVAGRMGRAFDDFNYAVPPCFRGEDAGYGTLIKVLPCAAIHRYSTQRYRRNSAVLPDLGLNAHYRAKKHRDNPSDIPRSSVDGLCCHWTSSLGLLYVCTKIGAKP